MKVLMICAAGFSSTLLMNRLNKYCEENKQDVSFEAVGIGGYQREFENGNKEHFDVILLGPQVGFYKDQIKKVSGLPISEIPSFDYATGNCLNIVNLAESLLPEAN